MIRSTDDPHKYEQPELVSPTSTVLEDFGTIALSHLRIFNPFNSTCFRKRPIHKKPHIRSNLIDEDELLLLPCR